MLGLAWVCGHALWSLRGGAPGAGAFLFALTSFLTASFGSALLIVGPHLFDKVEVSERWARMAVGRDRSIDSTMRDVKAPPGSDSPGPETVAVAWSREGRRA